VHEQTKKNLKKIKSINQQLSMKKFRLCASCHLTLEKIRSRPELLHSGRCKCGRYSMAKRVKPGMATPTPPIDGVNTANLVHKDETW